MLSSIATLCRTGWFAVARERIQCNAGLGCLLLFALACPPSSVDAKPLLAAPSLSFETGRGPSAVAIGDVNRDGRPDLVVANQSSRSVSVLLGNGDGTVEPRRDYEANSNPTSVTIADLNGDGKPDLTLSNLGVDTVSVLLGNGDGTFEPKRDYITADPSYSVSVGDLDGDSIPDLAVANYQFDGLGKISALLGNGDGSFKPRLDYDAGGDPMCVTIGDLNGDGKPDLSVANFDSASVSVLLGNGDGTFGPATAYPAWYNPRSVAIGDLNGDGKPDLAVGSQYIDFVPEAPSSVVAVLLGIGDGTFQRTSYYATGVEPRSVVIGDVNGDGKLDLALACATSNAVSVLPGNGDGTFGPKIDLGLGDFPCSVAIGDLNGDGMLDFVVTNPFDNSVSVLLNSGPYWTATLLSQFEANGVDDGVEIRWQFGKPGSFTNDHLERGDAPTGPWTPVQGDRHDRGELTAVLDRSTQSGQTYYYRLLATSRDGSVMTFGPISATAQEAIAAFMLSPLSPNPSTGRLLVTFAIPTRTRVRLTLTDVQGREVAVLVDDIREAGRFTATLDASDLRAGMYFVRMQATGVNLTRRLALVK
jgi:VCBS repeat protein/type IX secretion system substrate protein/FG-GAP repeat protein